MSSHSGNNARLLFFIGAAAIAAAGAFSAELATRETVPHFTDIASKSHLTYRTNNGYRDRKWLIAAMCGGVSAIDYDRDGRMDLFLTNGASIPEMKKTGPEYYNRLIRNAGNGVFEDVTAKSGLAGESLGYSFGAAVGDYDNDGSDDIFVANAGRDTLYHNNGDGTFTDVTKGSGLDTKPANTISVGAAWFDYDNDGLLDLVVSEYTTWTPETDVRCHGGPDNGEVYCHPKNYPGVPNRLYHNLGHGKFEDVTEKSGFGKVAGKGMGIVIADFNRDGFMDVFVANDTERNFLYLNKGNGTFDEVGLLWGVAYNEDGATVSGMGADGKDYDNDGWPDIFYNDLAFQTFALFHNEGGTSFRYDSPQSNIARLSRNFSGWGAQFVDYDNDGFKDIYNANGDVDVIGPNSKQHDTLWRNTDGQHFEDVSEKMGADFMKLGYHRGSAIVDLNDDGFPDIVVTGLGEPPRIMMNSGDANHWLMLDLTGTKSNRDAIGAQVKVTTASGRTLYNHVVNSAGFMGSVDKRLQFGLGHEKTVKSIEIRWPSGIVQTLTNPQVDRFLKVTEKASS